MEISTVKQTPKRRITISLRRIGYYLVEGLISRTELFGEIMPFGAAVYATDYADKPPYLTGVIALLSTVFPHAMPAATLKYAVAMLLFSLIAVRKGETVTKTPVRRGALMGVCVFLAGLLMLAGGQIFMYDCFALLLEGSMTFGAVYLFANAKKTIVRGGAKEAPLEVLSVAALCGVAIVGVGSLLNLYGISVTVPLCVLAVLILSHGNGITAGAISGITLGLMATVSNGNPVLGAFAVGGLAAGCFSRYGKAGAAVSFLLANSVVTFYTGGTTEMVINLYELIAPTLLYLALPRKAICNIDAGLRRSNGRVGKMKETLAEELEDRADAFSFLANTFADIADEKLYSFDIAAPAFFERTARHACDGCGTVNLCWKKEFHRTYTAFFVMLEICGRNGKITEADIPDSVAERCMRKTKLLGAFNTMYEVYRADKLWESRMRESRRMVGRQLGCMARILDELAKNTRNGVTFDSASEEFLRARLTEQGIAVRTVDVTQRRRGGYTVHIRTTEKAEAAALAAIVGEALAEPMCAVLEEEKRCKLVSVYRYGVDMGRSGVAKDKSAVSGDSCDCVCMENGCYMLAVSDGMGSGERAAIDSRATVNMLKALLTAGFDTDMAIGLVNSVLVLKSKEEAFATIDLALINTRRGEVEFIKVGAARGYMKHGGEVKEIGAGTLPVGILEKPDVARVKMKIARGDMIVLVTDGIADADRTQPDGAWVADAIKNYSGNDPQALSAHLLALARAASGNRVSDDMTVLAASIKENSCAHSA